MGKLSLQEAFAVFGGKPANRLHSLSALAADGTAMIISCHARRFTHPKRGVLRYNDTLTGEGSRPAESQSLGQHLTQARDANLPIRMIVVTEKPDSADKMTRELHVRTDLVGKLVEFDGERYVIDFIRADEPAKTSTRK
jgi:hypothetical protein